MLLHPTPTQLASGASHPLNNNNNNINNINNKQTQNLPKENNTTKLHVQCEEMC